MWCGYLVGLEATLENDKTSLDAGKKKKIYTRRVPLAALRGFVFSFPYSYSAKGLGGFGVACSGDQCEEATRDVLTREINTRT